MRAQTQNQPCNALPKAADYLHLAECAFSQTHLPLLFLAFLFSKLLKGEFDGRMQTLFTTKPFSQALPLFLPLLSESLTLTSSSLLPLFPLTHLSFILNLPFIVFFSGSACSLKGPFFPSLPQMFFLLLGLLLCRPPPHFCIHLIFHLNTFSVSLPHLTHASPFQLDGSGSLFTPPPPTYHRVYYVCHRHLLPACSSLGAQQDGPSQSYTHGRKCTQSAGQPFRSVFVIFCI